MDDQGKKDDATLADDEILGIEHDESMPLGGDADGDDTDTTDADDADADDTDADDA